MREEIKNCQKWGQDAGCLERNFHSGMRDENTSAGTRFAHCERRDAEWFLKFTARCGTIERKSQFMDVTWRGTILAGLKYSF